MRFDSEELWRIRLDLQAKPKQSMTIGVRKTKDGGTRPVAFTKASVKNYVTLLIDLLAMHRPDEMFTGPLQVEIVTALPFKKSEKKGDLARGWRFKDTSPDFDNYGKPLCDAMQGIVYKNDGQISRGIITKICREQVYIVVIVSQLRELE